MRVHASSEICTRAESLPENASFTMILYREYPLSKEQTELMRRLCDISSEPIQENENESCI